jgi:predicted HTH domain antitoxin
MNTPSIAPLSFGLLYSVKEANMPLLIPDETLRAAGMNEQEARVEIACRWFDAGKLSFGHAAGFAGLSALDFEAQLEQRGLPRQRYTDEMLERDIETLKKLGRW